MNSINNAAEKKLQVCHEGAWYFVQSIAYWGTQTTTCSFEALSDDYLSVVANKFPDLTFRSI